jgi:hypothetical protein
LAPTNGPAAILISNIIDQVVSERLMVPFAMVEVDNPTPIILRREKSAIHGIRGSVALSLWMTCSSSMAYPAAVLRENRHVEL